MTWHLPYLIGAVGGFSTYAFSTLSITTGVTYGLGYGLCAWIVLRRPGV